MEIWFYHLTRQPLDRVLPGLIEKSLERKWSVVIQIGTQERMKALDALLWTYSDSSFLAHGIDQDEDAERQPIYLTTGFETPNAAKVRFFVDGALIAPFLTQPAAGFERLILMFEGNQDDQLVSARQQWAQLKQQGLALAYWQQDEDGRWQKKA